ncbi:hypothetical protein HAX54_046758, partial [Datura stramonium]|nr:hypothetical protein [Datura stramonium]
LYPFLLTARLQQLKGLERAMKDLLDKSFKILCIRIGSPTSVNVQQARDILCGRASAPKDISRPNSLIMLIWNPYVAKALKEYQQGDTNSCWADLIDVKKKTNIMG